MSSSAAAQTAVWVAGLYTYTAGLLRAPTTDDPCERPRDRLIYIHAPMAIGVRRSVRVGVVFVGVYATRDNFHLYRILN